MASPQPGWSNARSGAGGPHPRIARSLSSGTHSRDPLAASGYAVSLAIQRRNHHETTDDPERSQPQSSGRARAAYLRHDDAGANQGELREGRGAAGTGAFLSPVEPRGRIGRSDPAGPRERGRHHHQSGWLFLHLDRDPRCDQGVRGAGDRSAHFQHPRARRISPAFEDIARCDRRDLRAGPAGLYRSDARAAADGEEGVNGYSSLRGAQRRSNPALPMRPCGLLRFARNDGQYSISYCAVTPETPPVKIVDLSRELYHRTPTYPGHPPIIHGVWTTHEESFVASGNVHGLSSMYISMPDHAGTHIDAPRHFNKCGQPINEYPLQNCILPGICIDLRHIAARAEITPADLEAAVKKSGAKVPKGGTGLLCTGHHARTFPRKEYATENSGVNVAATQWLANQGVVHFGIDSMRPGAEGKMNSLVLKAC